MIEINLPNGRWSYDPNEQLGPKGGFGTVFKGVRSGVGDIAVKRLDVTQAQGAHRELRLADELTDSELEHVMPILDAGKDANSDGYFIVMPMAEGSLQEELSQRGRFGVKETVEVAKQICAGLAEVPGIVHRDLKPRNILFHDGGWSIADFGIARFVEESTSLRTLKDCLTPPYAAPEQWKLERARSETDMYALGCIIFSLLTGDPPFPGPRREDFREQHLDEPPPPLPDPLTDSQLQSLTSMLLRKRPETRPDLARVTTILEEIFSDLNGQSSAGGNSSPLATAGARVARERAAAEAEEARSQRKQRSRERLADEALTILDNLVSDFFSFVQAQAPVAATHIEEDQRLVTLGKGTITFEYPVQGSYYPKDAFSTSEWDIVCGGRIHLVQEGGSYERSASLWYGNIKSEGKGHRWYQVSYFTNLTVKSIRDSNREPFAAVISRADSAAQKAITKIAIAYGPEPIDDEAAQSFFKRWADLLARAAEGKLRRPSRFPLSE